MRPSGNSAASTARSTMQVDRAVSDRFTNSTRDGSIS